MNHVTMKVILPAKHIPAGSKVTKKTGSKVYTLNDKIVLYKDREKPQIIQSSGDSMILLGDNGSGNIVDGDQELIWLTDGWQVMELIEKDIEEIPQ